LNDWEHTSSPQRPKTQSLLIVKPETWNGLSADSEVEPPPFHVL
jgi:hypothetical protein